MLWSKAVEIVEQKALAVGLKDEYGVPYGAEEALAFMVCVACWEELNRELLAGTLSPDAYISWGTAYIDQYRRERVRKRTERFLKSVPHKIPNAGSVKA